MPSAKPIDGLSPDYVDLLSALNAHGVKYLLVGGYAVGAYSQPRATKDLDIFILSSEENSLAMYKALADFGAPLDGLTHADFSDRRSVFQMGQPPLRVYILQVLSGVEFEECWAERKYGTVNDEFKVPVISADHLRRNKLAVGRPQDLLDVEEMERTVRLLAKD